MNFISGKGVVFVPKERVVQEYSPAADSIIDTEEVEVFIEEVFSDEIVVTAFGVVSYLLDGARHVGYNLPVRIDEAEGLPLGPTSDTEAPVESTCPRCDDDTLKVARWNPPVCPQCGRR